MAIVALKVIRIEAYRRDLESMDEGLTAKLTLVGDLPDGLSSTFFILVGEL